MEEFAEAREDMLRTIEAKGFTDADVLAAMRRVPRQRFVDPDMRGYAHDDRPLPIGAGQTISQPYIVASMSSVAQAAPGKRILEVGTGCGYQAAVLAELGAEVYTMEIIPALAERARALLEGLGYGSVRVSCGDAYGGWPEAAPFDAIVVTAAPRHVPPPLLEQLSDGGRLIIPVGDVEVGQDLEVYTRRGDRFDGERLFAVRFVPMTGEAQEPALPEQHH
ncbi:MAG TPA: protein-L-isoaspartate(D-aspartate) O-methyltransferase [Myxococcota bacterium]|nr:protein-L-isoaspartate(D-aspartate) O-methyltransferase [Myxococcota bacterium]